MRDVTSADGDPPDWHHETAYVNGIELHYVTVPPDRAAVDHPTGAAPLVVLLHGFPEFWYTWRHQLAPLASAGYRVVAPDLRGYNRSSAPDGVDSYRTAELVADIRALVEHRGAPQATLVGHDWGGLLAWETALREPDFCRRLVVLNAPHPDVYRQRLRQSPEQVLRSWYVLAAQVPWLPERLLGFDEYRLLDTSRRLLPGDAFTDDDIARYREAIDRSGSLSGPLNYYRAAARETLETELRSLLPGNDRRLRQVDIPTHVFWGEQDPVLGLDLLDGLEDVASELTVTRFPDTSHWPHLERPQRVTDELLAVPQS